VALPNSVKEVKQDEEVREELLAVAE